MRVNVKAFLAKEDGDFVSLDDVLRSMMRSSDCSYQDAAIVLLRLIERTRFSPVWYLKSTVYGVRELEEDDGEAMQILRRAAHVGKAIDPDDIPF